MWYHPAAFYLGKRDVVGAWLICLALAVAFFGYPVVTAALDGRAGDLHIAAAAPNPLR
jgi:hypothetical protein